MGVTIPDGEDIFSSYSTIGIEGGIGASGFDVLISSRDDTGCRIDFFNKNK